MGKRLEKKRLYKLEEYNKEEGGLASLFIFIIDFVYLWKRIVNEVDIKVGINEFTLKLIGLSILSYIIFEIITFPLWYFPKRKRQRIIENGKVHTGKYIDIISRRKLIGKGNERRYKIFIELDDSGLVIEDGHYGEHPGYYIRKNQKCKVYEYNGKFYPDIIYYDPKVNKEKIFEHYEYEEE